jgi:hypothetical protein
MHMMALLSEQLKMRGLLAEPQALCAVVVSLCFVPRSDLLAERIRTAVLRSV